MRVKGNDKDERRAAILQAAYRLFGKVGYTKATMKGIAAEAGVAQGLIGYHFGTKEALLVAVVREWIIHRGMKEAFSRINLQVSADQVLLQALQHVAEFRKNNPEWFTLLVSLWLESLHREELARELNEIYKEMKRGVVQVIDCMELKITEQEKETMASTVQAVFDGLTLQTAFLQAGDKTYAAQLFPAIDWILKGASK